MTVNQAQATSEPASWFWCWVRAILLGFGANHVYTLGARAHDDSLTIISALLWLFAVSQALRGMKAWGDAAAFRSLYREAHRKSQSSTDHGAARWASVKDLRKAGMLKSNKSTGIFLGQLKGKPIYHNGEGSILALAGPGQGKTTALAAIHLLANKTSTIVIDPKGELYATTHRQRERMGHRVIGIAPWADEMREQSGGKLKLVDDGFDPCHFLDAGASSVIDDAKLLAALLIPDSGAATETSSYFKNLSREILSTFMLLGLERKGSVTLPELRAMLMASDEELSLAFGEMATSTAFSGVLAQNGKRLSSPFMNAPKEWAAGHGGACDAVAAYDAYGLLGRSVRKQGYDFRCFRDRPTTVYIVIPPDRIATHGETWLATCITVAQELIARDRRPSKVTMLIDELQNLGRQEQLLRGLALYRGAGIRYVFLVQFVSALQRLYGPSWREFLGCEVVMAFGASSDIETLKLLSELAGHETFAQSSFSEQANGVQGERPGFSTSTGNQGRPLLRPEDIRTLGKDQILAFVGTLPPILARKVSYLKWPQLRRRADRNPYYRKRWW